MLKISQQFFATKLVNRTTYYSECGQTVILGQMCCNEEYNRRQLNQNQKYAIIILLFNCNLFYKFPV